MASKTAKWLIGCGLGCLGVGLIVVVLVSIGSVSLIRNTTEGFAEAVRTGDDLQERFGEPADFVPAADGRLAPDRVEAFLSVRDATRPARERIEKVFRALPSSREDAEALDAQPPLKKIGSIFGITRSAFGLGADLGDFLRARNRGLLETGMSLGEYTYIYVIAYVSWLGHELDDGPEIGGGGGSAMVDRDVVQRVKRDLLDMLRSQLSSLSDDQDSLEWRESLEDEVARLEADNQAVPWQNGLPKPIADSLAPYRQRLESSFSAYSNPFELGQAHQRGRFSFDME